jgi:DNA-binding NarL/FixJ family response regulator
MYPERLGDVPSNVAPEQVFRVAIVDEQPVSRTGLRQLATEDPRFRVVASVDSVNELEAQRPPFDVVVLSLPLRSGESPLSDITRIAQLGHPLVISAWDRTPTLLAAIQAGARACVTRQADQQVVTDALRAVARGGLYLCHRLVGQFHDELAQRRRKEHPNGLAPREVETLRWIALGLTHVQIARRMGVSPATVNTYAKRIRSKLNVSNKAQLTRMAIELGHLDGDHGEQRAA